MSMADDYIDRMMGIDDRPTKAQIRRAELPRVKTVPCHCKPYRAYVCPTCRERKA